MHATSIAQQGGKGGSKRVSVMVAEARVDWE